MKKCNLRLLLWGIAGIAALGAVVWTVGRAWIRYRKKQKVLGCTKDAMQMVGKMMLHIAGEKM